MDSSAEKSASSVERPVFSENGDSGLPGTGHVAAPPPSTGETEVERLTEALKQAEV